MHKLCKKPENLSFSIIRKSFFRPFVTPTTTTPTTTSTVGDFVFSQHEVDDVDPDLLPEEALGRGHPAHVGPFVHSLLESHVIRLPNGEIGEIVPKLFKGGFEKLAESPVFEGGVRRVRVEALGKVVDERERHFVTDGILLRHGLVVNGQNRSYFVIRPHKVLDEGEVVIKGGRGGQESPAFAG